MKRITRALKDRKVRRQMRRDCPELSALLDAVAQHTKKGKA